LGLHHHEASLANSDVAGFVGRNQVFLHQYTGQMSGDVSKLIPEFYSLLRTMDMIFSFVTMADNLVSHAIERGRKLDA